MKDNIKLGLLGLIAILVIYNTVQISKLDAVPKKIVERPNSKNTFNNAPASNSLTPDLNAEPAKPSTQISFAETNHSFGTIKQDTENKKIFTFTNTGDNPLIIENAKGSCGCTVPTYPRQPIQPGETGEIEVIYKPGKQKGNQQKTVTITANTEPKNTMLYISAEVEEVK